MRFSLNKFYKLSTLAVILVTTSVSLGIVSPQASAAVSAPTAEQANKRGNAQISNINSIQEKISAFNAKSNIEKEVTDGIRTADLSTNTNWSDTTLAPDVYFNAASVSPDAYKQNLNFMLDFKGDTTYQVPEAVGEDSILVAYLVVGKVNDINHVDSEIVSLAPITSEDTSENFLFNYNNIVMPHSGRNYFQILLLGCITTEGSATVCDLSYDSVGYAGAGNDWSVTNNAQSKVYRFWSDSYRGHFYTNSASEKDALISGNPNWSYNGPMFNVGGKLNESTCMDQYAKPVYRFWSNNYRKHFYTISLSERNALFSNSNWQYERVAFCAYENTQENRDLLNHEGQKVFTPLYRFWSDNYKGHFYTSSAAERDSVKNTNPNWRQEADAYLVRV